MINTKKNDLELLLKKPITEQTLDIFKEYVWLEKGLANEKIRKKIWPFFLGINMHIHDTQIYYTESMSEDRQINVDIQRSVNHLSKAICLSPSKVQHVRHDLTRILKTTLHNNPGYKYYQGYHDIAEFFYLIGGKRWCTKMMDSFSFLYLYDILIADPQYTLFMLFNVFSIINIRDSKFANYLIQLDNSPPIYLLSFFTTFFVHDLTKMDSLERLFDMILVSHPFIILYIIAAVLLSKRDEIYKSQDPLMYIRQLKQTLEDDYLPIEAIIRDTHFLLSRLPPSKLIYEYNYYYTFIPKSSIYINYNNVFQHYHIIETKKQNMNSESLCAYIRNITLDDYNTYIYINNKNVGFGNNQVITKRTQLLSFLKNQNQIILAASLGGLAIGIPILHHISQYF